MPIQKDIVLIDTEGWEINCSYHVAHSIVINGEKFRTIVTVASYRAKEFYEWCPESFIKPPLVLDIGGIYSGTIDVENTIIQLPEWTGAIITL